MASWEQNKNFIISKVNAGTADAGQQAWYDTWVAAGSPATQTELQAWKAKNTGASGSESPTAIDIETNFFVRCA